MRPIVSEQCIRTGASGFSGSNDKHSFAAQCGGAFCGKGATMIRGNTSERFQEIAVAAEQLAGPAFINQTGTLVERLEKAVKVCREASWMSRGAVDEIERLLNAAKVAELLRRKPR